VDTNHFRGNHPEACSLEAVHLGEDPAPDRLDDVRWTPLVPRSPLTGHSENRFRVNAEDPVTHLRLNIFPDGGVARLRVLGEVRPDWERLAASPGPIDLVSVLHGGIPVAASDQFFSEPLNLIMPGRAAHMGDGWETRRRRGPGHDWVILQLGKRGIVRRVEVDTNHFKGNFPESARLEGCLAANARLSDFTDGTVAWKELLPRTKLSADHRHEFRDEVLDRGAMTHVRLSIFPDGGVSRLRVWGDIS
jgi:allantoicase